MFDLLGVYGLHDVEDVIVAGLVTGDPVLLVGPPGCAKTLLVRRLAGVLGLRFHAYDASKTLFEDLVGFPSPKALTEGRVEYAPTPLSVFDKQFILVDEISRASPSTANKWLEVIRSRTVMGLPLPRLQFVFAAMNPPGESGTAPLDAAMADRFAFHVSLPDACEMAPEDLRRVIGAVTEDDAQGLRKPALAGDPPDFGLSAFLAESQRRYAQVEAAIGGAIDDYLVAFAATMKSANVSLSGRRLGMMRRNIFAVLAVRGRTTTSLAEVAADVRYAVRCSLPHAAAGVEVRAAVVASAHALALRGGKAGAQALDFSDSVRLAESYVRAGAHALSDRRHQQVASVYEEALQAASRPAPAARAFMGLHRVLRAVQAGEVRPPADVIRRFGNLYQKSTGADATVDGAMADRLAAGSGSSQIDDPAFRLACVLCADEGRRPRKGASTGVAEFERTLEEIRDEFEADSDFAAGMPSRAPVAREAII